MLNKINGDRSKLYANHIKFNAWLKDISIYTLDVDTESYRFSEVNNKITCNFYDLICIKFKCNPNYILCTRGDSKKDIVEHDRFFDKDLNKVFIVGAKSNYHLSNPNANDEVNRIYEHTRKCYDTDKCHDDLVRDLADLRTKVNDAMNTREKENFLKRLEYFNELELDTLDIEKLYELKIFFLSFFHTDGRLKEFNTIKPFLSMTHGSNKFSIAKDFAFGDDSTKEKAYMYLYALNIDNTYHLKTKDLSEKLNKEGATWHKDLYDEIILFNGMFPHYLLGIFELVKDNKPRLIINPSLFEILDKNEEFDFVDGLEIDQRNFKKYAKDLKYERYFYKTSDNKQHTSNMNGTSKNEVISP